jgi:hypothetical protein
LRTADCGFEAEADDPRSKTLRVGLRILRFEIIRFEIEL